MGDTTGTGAAGTTAMGATLVGGITLTNPGSGYVTAPNVSFLGDGSGATATTSITIAPVTVGFRPMGIQELFDPFYGRMNATMSMEIPNTNGTIQTTIPYGYIDPPTELINTNASDVPWRTDPARDVARRDADLEVHPQRGGHPFSPLPHVQHAAHQPGWLGRRSPAA